jgi:hypothetical protein
MTRIPEGVGWTALLPASARSASTPRNSDELDGSLLFLATGASSYMTGLIAISAGGPPSVPEDIIYLRTSGGVCRRAAGAPRRVRGIGAGYAATGSGVFAVAAGHGELGAPGRKVRSPAFQIGRSPHADHQGTLAVSRRLPVR